MPNIICPHCKTSRDMSLNRLPTRATNARCPHCYKSFHFDPTGFPSEPSTNDEPTNYVICPQCSLPRKISAERITDPQATISCRRCQQIFRLDEGRSSDRKSNDVNGCQLTSIGSLLTQSWELLCRRGLSLFSIYLLASLFFIVPLLLAAIYLPGLVAGNKALAWLFLAAGFSYGFFGAAWLTATLFQQVVKPRLNTREALFQGWQNLGKFAWLLLILMLTIGGGALLFGLPGILFTIWFFFSQYILAETGTGGLAALVKSHQLVRGHWWAICARILLLVLVSVAISTTAARLPMIGSSINLVLPLLLVPFSLLYYNLVYEDLKRCQANHNPPPQKVSNWFYLTAPILGWLLIPGLLFVASNPTTQKLLPFTEETNSFFFEYSITPQQSLAELTTEQGGDQQTTTPSKLSAAGYDRLLADQNLPKPSDLGSTLGPISVQLDRRWPSPTEPQLWLDFTVAKLPNLSLARRHSLRVTIDTISDKSARQCYNRLHNLETPPFHWVNLTDTESLSGETTGKRNIYLQAGCDPKQISRISGSAELNLPLNVESITLTAADIGQPASLAGEELTLTKLATNQVTLFFSAERSRLLDLEATGPNQQPLRKLGESWQHDGQRLIIQQTFTGPIEQLQVHVAAEVIQRNYPFTIELN